MFVTRFCLSVFFSIAMSADNRSRITFALLATALAFNLFGLGCQRKDTPSPAPVSLPSSAPAQQKTEAPDEKIQSQIGFASRRKLIEHYEKHRREFGSITPEEYLRLAQTLRDRPVGQAGNEALEIVRPDGVLTRFDRATGAFLAFDPDLTIRTFFKPNDGVAYFRRQAKRSRN
jgi:hypothetical protein